MCLRTIVYEPKTLAGVLCDWLILGGQCPWSLAVRRLERGVLLLQPFDLIVCLLDERLQFGELGLDAAEFVM